MSRKQPITQNPSYSLNAFNGILSYHEMFLVAENRKTGEVLGAFRTSHIRWMDRPLN